MRSWMGVVVLALVACNGGTTAGEVCGDGTDNDADGFADCEDLECADDVTCDGDTNTDDEDCGNGEDDDDDGDVDCDDSDCDGDSDCEEPSEDCDNGTDDDGDGNVDCDDAECATHVDCQDTEDCDNGTDDDGDGDADCDDSDCFSDPACATPSEDCDNGTDDDGDGRVDCDDSECASDPACVVSYTDYDGYEEFTYGIASKDDGAAGVDCQVHWNATGTPLAPCSGCTFAFDVTLDFDATQSTDNGTWSDCATLSQDYAYGYAFTEDYYGYGPYALYSTDGVSFSAWAAASFDGTNFVYTSGVSDYYYDNSGGGYPAYTGAVYLTFYYYGYAVVQ